MPRPQFNPGDIVRVWYDKDGTRVEYTAKVLRPAVRAGDYDVQVITVGPGSEARVGAVYAPMLGGPVQMEATR